MMTINPNAMKMIKSVVSKLRSMMVTDFNPARGHRVLAAM